MSNYANIRNMVYNLLSLLERIKINLACWLNPFKIEMRGKLLFFSHYVIILPFFKEITHQFTVVAFPNKYFFILNFIALVKVYIIQGWICKNRELIAQPLISSLIQPFMLLAVANKFTLEPTVNWSIVKFDIIIRVSSKFIWIEYLNCTFLPSGTYRFSVP